jgi:serine/threonine-protein kinase
VKEPLASKAQERVGQTFAKKWHIDRLLDIGGMASVFAATHRNGNRVAIKVLHSMFATESEVAQRFLEEGYVANKVGHPAAVQVLDDDTLEDGTPFIVMELLIGESLEARLKQVTVLSPNATLYVADRVLDVLAAGHDKGIIHRDIKPANVFLTQDGGVKVLDYGLARVRERTLKGSLTRTGMVIGTASYMPPEQARGKRDLIDARTDIWAVGAMMWKTMTGRYVHEGDTVNERLLAAMSQKAPSLGKIMPSVPRPVVEAVDRSLEFQKTDRFDDARQMQAALRKAYETTEKKTFPGSIRPMPPELGGARVDPSEGPVTTTSADLNVSVVFDPGSTVDSIVVDFEDTKGNLERYEVKPRGETPIVNDDDVTTNLSALPEVTIQEVERPKPPPKPRRA